MQLLALALVLMMVLMMVPMKLALCCSAHRPSRP